MPGRPQQDITAVSLAPKGLARIEWAEGQMPVLRSIRERFRQERPLDGAKVAACLHVTAETANLMQALIAGGARVALCSANPLTVRDEVAAALVEDGVPVQATRGEDAEMYAKHVGALAEWGPDITLDDGADLLMLLHRWERPVKGGAEETRTGLLRLRRLEHDGKLTCPVLAVNESRTERTFNDRYGTGQSALDGIL